MSVLRVVTYNVARLRGGVGALASVIRPLDADVVLAQEAPGLLRWRARCADLARACRMVVGAGGQPARGNLILTSHRVAVHEERWLRYPLIPGHHLRGAALASCSVARTPFWLVGTHLSTDAALRPQQAACLKEALAKLDAPVVLGGDLNDSPGAPAWLTLADGRLDTATADGHPTTDKATFPSVTPTRRIDAIFVADGYGVERHEVVDTAEARRASDHLPVVADIVLP